MTGAVVLALPVRGLAAEINTEHKLADRAVWNQLQHARRCGELLREQKEQLPHGRWLSWLDELYRTRFPGHTFVLCRLA